MSQQYIAADRAGLEVGKTYTVGESRLTENGWRKQSSFTGQLISAGLGGYTFLVGRAQRHIGRHAVLYRLDVSLIGQRSDEIDRILADPATNPFDVHDATVTVVLSCGCAENVHEASSLFDYPECATHRDVTISTVDGHPYVG